nr:DNA mismatch repair endonuclease MutL [Lachnospiraceae bacterium]
MIRLLDKETIDRIAAGEVVENPRSVVKELVENSFDAGAHRVTIQIRDGGRSLIRVSDDGCGIEAGEVLTAFERHATSKIKNSDDLSFISTMGFRGEALSSIAAVSRTELVTKCEKDLTGVRVTADGGQISEPEEIGAPGGTTVIVRDLFFNVPARRKFLKTARSEANQVYDTVVKLALSRPDVSVSYIQDNRAVFQTGGNNNLKEAAYRIFGKEVTKSLIPVEFGDDELGVRVKGYLGAPSENRSNREMEYFFINGRTVLSKVFSKALEEGGTGFFMQHRFPVCFLHFTIDTDRVDVNVHPSKLTVRLPDEPEIYNFICDRVAEAYKAEERVPDRDPESRDRGPGADIREASALPGMVRDKNEENESSAPKTVERGTLFDEEKDESKGAESFDGDRQEDQDESKGAELFDDDKAGNSGNELFDDEKASNSGGELFGDEKAGNSGGELFDDEKEDHNSVNKDEEHFADDNGNRHFDDRKYINKGSDPGEDTINGAGGRSYNDLDNMEVSSPDGNTYNSSGSSPDTENGEDGRKASPAPELNDFKETTGEQESMDFGNDPGNKDPRILSG